MTAAATQVGKKENELIFTHVFDAPRERVATAEAAPYLAGMEQGWSRSLDRFDAHLAKG